MGRAPIRGKPAVLLMDEPLASLDVGMRSELRAVIRDGLIEDIGSDSTCPGPDRTRSH
jgi:ABC-type sugar transport system ATPase subunit